VKVKLVIFIPNAITKGPGCCSYLKMQQETTQCMLLSTTSPNIDRFSKCFTSRLISSLNAIKRSVKTPPNHKRIATLSFAILMSIFGENYGQQRMMSPFSTRSETDIRRFVCVWNGERPWMFSRV